MLPGEWLFLLLGPFGLRMVEPKTFPYSGVNAREGLVPDDEGYSLPGELQIGSYAALEGDLGESLMGPLGFSAVWEDVEEQEFAAGGVPTVPATVVFQVRGLG